ncbi:MAG: hypothetical protein NVS3B20_20660 [Polyangiales bacterium]
MALLPEPDACACAMVIVAPKGHRGGFLSRVFGRDRSVPRPVRGAALLLKGYSDIAGGVDPDSGLDLVWGRP